MEERVIWLVMCGVHRLLPRSWIWCFGIDRRPLNLHRLRMPRRRNAEEFPFLREDFVLKGPFSKDGNVGWKKISKKGSRQKPVVGLMQLTETCASLDSNTSVWC